METIVDGGFIESCNEEVTQLEQFQEINRNVIWNTDDVETTEKSKD